MIEVVVWFRFSGEVLNVKRNVLRFPPSLEGAEGAADIFAGPAAEHLIAEPFQIEIFPGKRSCVEHKNILFSIIAPPTIGGISYEKLFFVFRDVTEKP